MTVAKLTAAMTVIRRQRRSALLVNAMDGFSKAVRTTVSVVRLSISDVGRTAAVKNDPYEKLRRAYEENRGTRLTAEDVDKLMDDVAIRDAVYQTHAEAQEEVGS